MHRDSIDGVMTPCSAGDCKVVGSSPGSASLIPEVKDVDVQLRAPLSLCSLPVHSAKCSSDASGNTVLYIQSTSIDGEAANFHNLHERSL